MKTPTPVELASGQVLVVGDAMLDQYWFDDVERSSPEAPVPVVHVQKREERLGGAANVARNVASFGPRTALLSATGQDEPGRTLMRLLGEAHIEPLVQADARPDFYVKGGDYDMAAIPESALVSSWGGAFVAIPFEHERSTTALLDRVRSGR